MQINITARHLRLTDAIDSYVRKKISKFGKFYDGDDVYSHVILSVEKNRQITEIVFHIGKISFRAKDQSEDLYASIDLASDKLEKQLKKHKEISKDHRKEISKEHVNLEEIFSYDVMDDSITKIAEIKRFDLKPVSIEEAIGQMDNLGYRVYMFKDGQKDKICVLYRNDSGSIVLLEPNEVM
ncbi:MAG: ribosome-associated translation inhibitor RaiA [Endomicrobium sp.]|uniref:ribosome hibernation-promoting factor, HPF/YfiA family n=1 Tax=Candidatus Endomicrobiellum cubanum TaxID=3242325 RepID=UPI00282C69C1|nr:ribosome-associated translation inhibitor RaiA [Endomicrobium sp.]